MKPQGKRRDMIWRDKHSKSITQGNFNKVELTGVEIGDTEQALLFDIDGDDVWIPRSLIEDMSIEDEYGFVTFFVPEWFAIQEGLV